MTWQQQHFNILQVPSSENRTALQSFHSILGQGFLGISEILQRFFEAFQTYV